MRKRKYTLVTYTLNKNGAYKLIAISVLWLVWKMRPAITMRLITTTTAAVVKWL